jgi:SRSO17 transposase
LCAVRKSALAAQQAQARLLRSASKRQKQLQPETLELAEYVAVLTTLPATIPCVSVLDLYRTRWQIELAFKRLKTLLGAGHVPKYDPDSARAWIYGKLLSVLLIERLSLEARLFSPWGFPLRAA